MTDCCVLKYKGHKPILDYKERSEIIKSLKFVYHVVPQDNFEFKRCTWLMSMKSIWQNDMLIFDNEQHHREMADILIPYLSGISSTEIKLRIVDDFLKRYESSNNC